MNGRFKYSKYRATEEEKADKVKDVIEVLQELLNKPANPGSAPDSIELDEKVQQIMKEAIERVKSISQDDESTPTPEFQISKKEKKKLKKRDRKRVDESKSEKAAKSVKGMRPITDFATLEILDTTITDTATTARQSFSANKRKNLTESGEKNAEKKGKKSNSVS